jgi:hypothetical protein
MSFSDKQKLQSLRRRIERMKINDKGMVMMTVPEVELLLNIAEAAPQQPTRPKKNSSRRGI